MNPPKTATANDFLLFAKKQAERTKRLRALNSESTTPCQEIVSGDATKRLPVNEAKKRHSSECVLKDQVKSSENLTDEDKDKEGENISDLETDIIETKKMKKNLEEK